MRISLYQEALRYLESFVDYEKVTDHPYDNRYYNLVRMEALLRLLGFPHQKYPSLHIAGTKGKGSTAAMVASILGSANYRVGWYTSPHLVSFRERIRIGDRLISPEELVELVNKVKSNIEFLREDSSLGKLTFFEVYTALAFYYFYLQKVDFAVLEVGMGGRLDATNVVNPLVSAITQISYDHTDKLGNSLVSIAREKAGIIKKNGVIITSPQPPEVLSVLEEISSSMGARIYQVVAPGSPEGKDRIVPVKVYADYRGQIFHVKGLFRNYYSLTLPLLGDHQIINAATAVGMVELLKLHSLEIGEEFIRDGLAKVNWSGRLEIVQEKPWIVVDGAHNVASAHCLRKAIQDLFHYRNLYLILGISLNKDIAGIGKELCLFANRVILTRASNARAADPHFLKEVLKDVCSDPVITTDVLSALTFARMQAEPEDLICITGSLYVVGEVLKLLRKPVPV